METPCTIAHLVLQQPLKCFWDSDTKNMYMLTDKCDFFVMLLPLLKKKK